MNRLLSAEQVVRLADRLAAIPAVAQFDRPGEPQGDTLAHALSDFEESLSAALKLMPKLLDTSLGPAELHDVLLDIGEELRHILYHVNDAQFFGYLLDQPESRDES